jgi:hypothetical protein
MSDAPSQVQEHLALATDLDAVEWGNEALDLRVAQALYELGSVVNYDPHLWVIRHGGPTTSADTLVQLCAALIRALVSNRKDGSSPQKDPTP